MTLLELIIIVFVSSAVMHADRHRMHRLVASDSALMEQMRRSWLSDLEKSWGPTRSQNILLPSPSVTPNSTDVGWSWMPLCFLSLVSLVLMGATFLLMIMRLRKNVRDLRVRLATADATHHQSERDLKSRDARIKDLQSSLDRTNHDLEYRNSALEDLQRRLDQTNGDLETRNSTISGLQVTIHNERASTNSHLAFLFIFFVFLLRNLPTTYLSTIVRLRKNVHDLQVSLADVGDVQTHLDQRDRDLKSRDSALRDLQARFDKSERDLESRESTIKDLEATIDDGRTANLTLQSQNERAMMTIANLTKEIELAREREKVYAVEVNDFQQKLTESVEACAATESVALAAEEMVVQGMTGSDSRPTEAQPPEDVTKADASGTLVEESDEGKGSKEEGEEKSSRKRHHRGKRPRKKGKKENNEPSSSQNLVPEDSPVPPQPSSDAAATPPAPPTSAAPQVRGVQTKEMRESATAAWSSFGANVGRLEAAEAAKQPPRHGPPELPTFATTWKPVRMGSVGERIVGRRIVSEHSPQPSGSNTRSSTAQKGGLGESIFAPDKAA